jgi:phosphoribosylanthranilate isomerase
LPLSLHLCGTFPIFTDESSSKKFKRIQINANLSEAYDNNLNTFLDIINKYSNFHKFIFQYNDNNKIFLESLSEKTKDFHVLYDSSLGRGSFIGEILPPPFHDIYTGYAGGINPDNILDIVKQVIKVDVGVAVYLDVESGIRTDNKWDNDKVERILKYV